MTISIEDKINILTELLANIYIVDDRVFTKFNPLWFDRKTGSLSSNKTYLDSTRHQIAKMDKLLAEEESDLDVDLMNKSDEYVPIMAILYEEFMDYLKTLEDKEAILPIDIPQDDGFKRLPVRLEGPYILELFKEVIPVYESLFTEVVAIGTSIIKRDNKLVDTTRSYFDKSHQRINNKINKFPKDTKWENITIEFNRDGDTFYVKNSINTEVKEFSYKDIPAFVDTRNVGNPPSKLYKFFKDLFKFNGFIPNCSIGIDSSAAFRQAICFINEALMEYIPLSDAGRPLANCKKHNCRGYNIRFNIKDPDPTKYSLLKDEDTIQKVMKENNVPFED